MTREIAGHLDGKGKRFGLVVSRFNSFISSKLVDGACDCLTRHGAADADITVIWTPGAFELPAVAARAVKSDDYDAVICLGAVIRGGTPHFDYVASEASKGVARIGLDAAVPVLFGVLTCDTIEQAIERAGTKAGNKGFDAALAALEMCSLYAQI